ncbi:hypothetical protein [Trinickia sp. Y13]|uniref:hypothetical protein n=2 Tax=unclassified Trinickia TaxID=2638168 RepID=UPI0024061892|nr:hypothetical protein [Trinickia sp. Y13]MDG0025945.1 hypothetical protein [Trinickia sp. Y13]
METSLRTAEAAMFDWSIGFMLALALFACAALAVATRYHTDHPLVDLLRWMDSHPWFDRLHHRH